MDNHAPRNILITGGAGFIGSHVAVRLAKRYPHYRVRGFAGQGWRSQGQGPALKGMPLQFRKRHAWCWTAPCRRLSCSTVSTTAPP